MSHPDMRLSVDDLGNPRLVQYLSLCGVWAVSPYSACDLRCSYCITFAQGKSTPRVTSNIAETVLREVQALPPDAVLAVGGLVDAYPSVEPHFGVTRQLLQALAHCGRPVIIVTKGPTVTRDIDIILQGNMRVCVSISSLDDAQLQRIEPYVAPASERMSAIEMLHGAGVNVCLQAQPWIPGVTDAGAMIRWANGRFPISFTPLNVDSPGVARTPLGRQFTQREINRAYLAECEQLGKNRLVQWQKPLWIGTTEFLELAATGDAGTATERRNLAAVQHLLNAFGQQAQYEALLALVSPYARGVDETGHATDADYPACGRTGDLLYALYEALDVPALRVLHIEASGASVNLRLQVSGIFNRSLFDLQPTHRFASLPVEYDYLFDGQGLVLDFTQRADLDSLVASQTEVDLRHSA